MGVVSTSSPTFEEEDQVAERRSEGTHPNPALKPPEVSFIVPCYRSGETVERTLNSILEQVTSLSFEILVVESSGDGTAESIRTRFPRVTVHALSSRTNAGTARNLGTAQAQGRYFAFLDADIVPSPEWLEQLHSRLASSSKIRLVSAAIANGNPTVVSRSLHWIEFSHYLFGLPSGFRPALSSSNLLIHRRDFQTTGGFDESMDMAEDLALSKRLTDCLYFDGSIMLMHYFRLDWQGVRAHLESLGYWSGLYRLKFSGSGSWLRHLPLLSFGLPCFRLPKIVGRVFQSSPLQGLNAVAHLPLILAGLFSWAKGFYSGIRVQRSHEE